MAASKSADPAKNPTISPPTTASTDPAVKTDTKKTEQTANLQAKAKKEKTQQTWGDRKEGAEGGDKGAHGNFRETWGR